MLSASESDYAIAGTSVLVAIRPDFNISESERIGRSYSYSKYDLNVGKKVVLHFLQVPVGSKGDCSDVKEVNALPLACVEVGKGMSR